MFINEFRYKVKNFSLAWGEVFLGLAAAVHAGLPSRRATALRKRFFAFGKTALAPSPALSPLQLYNCKYIQYFDFVNCNNAGVWSVDMQSVC